MTTIKFKLLYPDSKPPKRSRKGDAGWDFYLHHVIIEDCWMCYTGVAVEIPLEFFGLLRPRSSVAKTPYSFNSSGVIDPTYRGEIIAPFRWLGGGVAFKTGDKIAQLVILPLPEVTFVQVNELSESERGEGGFGSTGQK